MPLATIEPDNNNDNNDLNNINYLTHWCKRPPLPSPTGIDLNTITPTAFTKSLRNINGEDVAKLLFPNTAPMGLSPLDGQPKCKAPDPLVCMGKQDIIVLLNKLDSSLPPIRPFIPQTHQIQNHIGWPKNNITSWVVDNFGIINTYSLFPRMVPILTMASSPLPSEPSQQFLRKAIDRTSSKYLGVVHLDIAFRD